MSFNLLIMSFTYTLIIRCITVNDKYIISEIIEIIYIILKRYNSKEMIETHWFIYKRVWYILTKDLKCRHIKSQHEINKNIVVLRKKMKL